MRLYHVVVHVLASLSGRFNGLYTRKCITLEKSALICSLLRRQQQQIMDFRVFPPNSSSIIGSCAFRSSLWHEATLHVRTS